MTIAASFGSFIGSAAGKTGAYAKHAVLAGASHAGAFGAHTVAAARESYAAKDAELAVRRAELNAARTARGALPTPARKSQRKLVTE